MKWFATIFFIAACFLNGSLSSLQAEEFMLKNNLQQAQPGDFLVIDCHKNLTLMHIFDRKDHILTIEEIAVPENKRPAQLNWKDWVAQQAPENTSWVMYDIDLRSGQMTRYYSYTKKNWFEIPDADNFLSKLLNLKLTKIPESARKRVGPKPRSGPELRSIWQPRMIVDGKTIEGVLFDAWKTDWPKDGSDLSNKTIEIYLPQNSKRYPSHFPYWLQINGVAGKAKIRIIDSGSNLKSPKPPLPAF